jgi:hypothetical protein
MDRAAVQKAHEGRISAKSAALVAGELPPSARSAGSGKAIPPGQPRAISILRHDVSSLAWRLTRSSDEVHVERFGSSDDKSPRAPPVELEP